MINDGGGFEILKYVFISLITHQYTKDHLILYSLHIFKLHTSLYMLFWNKHTHTHTDRRL